MTPVGPKRLTFKVLSSPKGAGIVMLAAMLLALLWVNSPLSASYELVHHAPLTISLGSFTLGKPLILWINEGLMAFFFFLIGLEIKREILEGQLSSLSQIILPGFGAIGGMVIPALIYLYFNQNDPESLRGWAVPVATDIVLVLALLSMLGSRVPISLKVFLTALAIFDDLGTLLVIATFYSEGLSIPALITAATGFAAAITLNRFKVSKIAPYALIGVFIWIAILESGVHATIAGFLLALTIPMKIDGKEVLKPLEHSLTPWISLGVIPVFAFFNAGIRFNDLSVEMLLGPISIGVILGLFVGKQIGVLLGVFLAVKFRFSRLPSDVSWPQIYGASILTGVGFTMGLFVVGLAFEQPGIILSTNFSIVIGSILSALLGMAVLIKSSPRPS